MVMAEQQTQLILSINGDDEEAKLAEAFHLGLTIRKVQLIPACWLLQSSK